MRKVKVGRGLDCDIVIPDETDNVSREHLVITFNILGRMKVSDTSSNGTYINDRRMLKGASIPVTPEDEIRMGDRWKLDWSQVKDPYRKTRQMLLILVVVVILGGIGTGMFFILNKTPEESLQIIVHKPILNSGDEWNKDSTLNVAPVEISVKVDEENVTAEKSASVSKNPVAGKRAGKKGNNNKQIKDKSSQKSGDEGKVTNEVPIVN